MTKIATTIKNASKAYNHKGFIGLDPVQFPHRYTEKRDVEISAFLTSLISFGQRSQIIKAAQYIDQMFNGRPYEFIRFRKWEQEEIPESVTLYRTIKLSDLYEVCSVFSDIYSVYGSLEDLVVENAKKLELSIVEALELPFHGINGVPDPAKGSACKRLNLFLRWLVRRDGIVDLGLWDKISPADLTIPLDTHVVSIARELGILTRKTPDMKAAKEITTYLSKIFPEDPTLGDFALFGLGADPKGELLKEWETIPEPASTEKEDQDLEPVETESKPEPISTGKETFATPKQAPKRPTKSEIKRKIYEKVNEEVKKQAEARDKHLEDSRKAINEAFLNNRALIVATTYNILFSSKIASQAVYNFSKYLDEAGLLRMEIKKQAKDVVRATQNYERTCYSVYGDKAKFLEESVGRIMAEIGIDVERLFYSIKSYLDKLRIKNSEALARLEQARTLISLSVEIHKTRMSAIKKISPLLPSLDYLSMDKILRLIDTLSRSVCRGIDRIVDLNEDNNCCLAVTVIDNKLANEDHIARAILLEYQEDETNQI